MNSSNMKTKQEIYQTLNTTLTETVKVYKDSQQHVESSTIRIENEGFFVDVSFRERGALKYNNGDVQKELNFRATFINFMESEGIPESEYFFSFTWFYNEQLKRKIIKALGDTELAFSKNNVDSTIVKYMSLNSKDSFTCIFRFKTDLDLNTAKERRIIDEIKKHFQNSLLKNEYPYDMIYLIDTFFDSNESKKEF